VAYARGVSGVIGTDKLGRPFTDEEKKRFGALLRQHDYPGARLIALRFAHNQCRSRQAAQDLMGRAELRLVRSGWDPEKVSLVRCLCRLVWSEWTHAAEETAARRKAEDAFLREVAAETGGAGASPESRAIAGETRLDAKASLDELRSSFEKAGDEVNLLWLDYSLKEIDDLEEMARLSKRDVREFYLAAERRKRHVKRLLAAKNGVKLEGDE
jgi:hypothetical protein